MWLELDGILEGALVQPDRTYWNTYTLWLEARRLGMRELEVAADALLHALGHR
jgi:hypothetical protein